MFESFWFTKIKTKTANKSAKIAPRESVKYKAKSIIQTAIFSFFVDFLLKILLIKIKIGARSMLAKNCGSIAKTLGRTKPKPCALHPAQRPQSDQVP